MLHLPPPNSWEQGLTSASAPSSFLLGVLPLLLLKWGLAAHTCSKGVREDLPPNKLLRLNFLVAQIDDVMLDDVMVDDGVEEAGSPRVLQRCSPQLIRGMFVSTLSGLFQMLLNGLIPVSTVIPHSFQWSGVGVGTFKYSLKTMFLCQETC